MRPIRLGDRVIAPGEGMNALSRERDLALEKNTSIKQRFQPDACQCCGARDMPGVVCVCDGLDWYILPGGAVECQAHRFARAIDPVGSRKKFWFFGKK